MKRNAQGMAVSVLIFALFACQSRSPEIVNTTPSPAEGPNDDWRAGDEFNNGDQWKDDDKAYINAQLSAADLVNYIDPNGAVSYVFKYLATNKSGDLTFANGVANLEFDGLEVGKAGTLSLDLLENNDVKLKGKIDNLTLKAGLNEIDLKLEPVGDGGGGGGGGGDDGATVKLTVTLPDAPGGGGGGGGGGNANFAEVKKLADEFCVRCHATANEEGWWQGKQDRDVSTLKRAMDGSGSLPMPLNGSPEANLMSNQDKQIMLKFLGG